MTYMFRRVLITGCAGEIGIAICKILRANNVAEMIFGCDVNPTGACEKYFDKLLLVNRADALTWIDQFKDIICQNEIDLIIPTVENELSRLVIQKFDLSKFLCPPEKIIATCLDKWETSRFLMANNLPVADTKLLSDHADIAYPLIVKPRSGRGSQNIYIVNTEVEFSDMKASLTSDDWVVQELLEPSSSELTCGLFRSKTGETRTLILQRVLKGGMTVSGVVMENEEVDAMLRRVADAFQLSGSINVQCILTDHGPKIFEINRIKHLSFTFL